VQVTCEYDTSADTAPVLPGWGTRLVVDHVVDAMRGRRGIEQARDVLRDIGVVADRHALGRGEAAHHGDRLRDVRIAVAVHERQPKHADIETFERQEKALGGELETGLLGEFGRGARLPERSISANDAPRSVASQ
jgi:hypothetical protein